MKSKEEIEWVAASGGSDTDARTKRKTEQEEKIKNWAVNTGSQKDSLNGQQNWTSHSPPSPPEAGMLFSAIRTRRLPPVVLSGTEYSDGTPKSESL